MADTSDFQQCDAALDLSAIVGRALPREIAGKRVLVAVSGGADSVAMLRALQELWATRSFGLIVAHLNHGLRGSEADGDADWVARLCESLAIRCVIDTADVSSAAGRTGATIEETARNLRYDFFKRIAREHRCQYVAVAHTADDQAETILHHIVRGTGLAGLRGMPARRHLADADDGSPIELIRPLLSVTRNDVEAYLRKLGQQFRLDDTNTDERFTRNRIRHVLLPLLRERFNPQVDDALLRLSQQAAEIQCSLDDIADRVLDRSLREETQSVCRLDVTVWLDEPAAVIRAALVRLWQRVGWPRQKMRFREWERLADLVRSDESSDAAMSLPGGIDARRRGNLVVLQRRFSEE